MKFTVKMGKIKTNKNNSRHDPLEKQLNDDDAYNKFGRVTQPKSKSNSDDREDGEETVSIRMHYIILILI